MFTKDHKAQFTDIRNAEPSAFKILIMIEGDAFIVPDDPYGSAVTILVSQGAVKLIVH